MSFLGAYRPTRLGFGPSSAALMTPRNAREMSDFIHEAYGPRIDAGTEFMAIVPMDKKGRVLRSVVIAEGTKGAVQFRLPDLFSILLAAGPEATRFFMAHNHPSGKPQPSGDDIRMTQTIMDALLKYAKGKWSLDDHIITTADPSQWGSIREGQFGYLWEFDKRNREDLLVLEKAARRATRTRKKAA